MRAVIKADNVNDRGKRTIIDGDAALLEGFEFNANASLSFCLKVQYVASIDRATGVLQVTIPAYVPKKLAVPPGTTHYKINSAGASIDFAEHVIDTQLSDSGLLVLDNETTLLIVSDITIAQKNFLQLLS